MTPEEFMQKIKSEVLASLNNKRSTSKLHGLDLRDYLIGALSHFFSERMKSRPLIQVVLQEIVAPPSAAKPKSVTST
jgi:hypothetical protein